MKYERWLQIILVIVAITMPSGAASDMAWAGNLFSGPVNSAAGASPGALAAGDFNSDGKLDLTVTNDRGKANGRNQVKVLLGNGNGTFQKPSGYKVGSEPTSVVTADFNKDGKLDLAVVNEEEPIGRNGRVSVLLGNGDGSFQVQVKYKVGIQPRKATVADFNGDGNLDLAVTTYTTRGRGRVGLLLGNGDGTFKQEIAVKTGHFPTYIVTGDLNGDGKPDLIVATAGISRDVKLRTTALLGNGDGTFRIAWSVGYEAETFGIVLGDFNGDGKLDLAQTYRRRITIRLGNGDGTFGDGSRHKLGFGGPMAIADFNGDGILDIAIAEFFLGNVEVLLGNGDGTFKPESTYPLSSGAHAIEIVAADLNNDGKPDLAVTDQFNHVVSVLLNTGKR